LADTKEALGLNPLCVEARFLSGVLYGLSKDPAARLEGQNQIAEAVERNPLLSAVYPDYSRLPR
jgi:hypothetical protein